MTREAKPARLADGAELEAFLEHNSLALVEFYTAGCPMCQAMEPVLGTVARATDVAVGMVNPGDDIALVERFEITSVPTLLLFRDGDPVARRAEGFQGAADVIAFLEAHAPAAVEAEGAD